MHVKEFKRSGVRDGFFGSQVGCTWTLLNWSAGEGEKVKDGFGILPKITEHLLLGKNRKILLHTLNSVLVW